MNTRLLGAAVLIALAVLFVPMFFSSAPPATDGEQGVNLAIPPAPDRDLKTQTMDLTPPAAASAGHAPTASGTAPSDRLPTVDIASRRPQDVGTDDTPAAADGSAGGEEDATPPAPAQPQAAAPAPTPQASAAATPAKETAATAQQAPASGPGTAANGHYTLNLSAYANAASAQRLIRQVRGMGYPVDGRTIHQRGKALTLVTAGPFQTRTAAEAARLKIIHAVPGAPARLESDASDQKGDAPAPAAGASRAGGYAVQVAAMASQADARALRDKLRGAGFDGFVDDVRAGGRQLWRVRVGPQTGRDDATRVREQIKAKLGFDGDVVSVP